MKKIFLKKTRLLLFFGFLVFLSLWIIIDSLRTKSGPLVSPYPNGKNFAFTITADPGYDILDVLVIDLLSQLE